jgi:hypothetical protein
MYHSAESLSKKNPLGQLKNTKFLWYIGTIFSWSILYFTFLELTISIDIVIFPLVTIGCIFLIGFLQGLIVNRMINILKYWILIVIFGFIFGIVWMIAFLGTLFLIVTFSTFFVDSLEIGNLSTILVSFVIPITYGLVFVAFTYGVWYKIIKPIHESNRLNEKKKLLLEGSVAIAVSLYIALSLNVVSLIAFAGNFVIACILSAFTFSFLSYSGFKEIFDMNLIFNIFPVKETKLT